MESHDGRDLSAAVNAALVYYVGRLDSGQRPPRVPNFDQEQGNQLAIGGAAAALVPPRPDVAVDVAVDERIEAALIADAAEQGTSLEKLAGHAVLVYLAELDLTAEATGEDGTTAVPAGEVDEPTAP
ncbi:MAG TPA: hypothetical protein VMH33_01520 [Solirubrobacterales bacterium]|nr:hypothetical protein [Solirubrobacterales bacterium]